MIRSLFFFWMTTLAASEAGMLFMIPYRPELGEAHFEQVKKLVLEHRIGGIISKATHRKEHIEGMKKLQKEIPWKLLVGVDAEWGIGMRFKDVPPLLKNFEVGERIAEVANACANEVCEIGAHVNFAPVVDTNHVSFLYERSFGEDVEEIKRKARIVVDAHVARGIIPTLKHFPGHGDVDIDSHEGLPVAKKMELIPFELASGRRDIAVMTAHIFVPSYGIATYSEKLVKGILRKRLRFDGLIFTDAMNMKALGDSDPIKALKAGHDILLYGDHIAPNLDYILRVMVPQHIAKVEKAIEEGELNIDASLRRRAFVERFDRACSHLQ